jgi:hypothetical protein
VRVRVCACARACVFACVCVCVCVCVRARERASESDACVSVVWLCARQPSPPPCHTGRALSLSLSLSLSLTHTPIIHTNTPGSWRSSTPAGPCWAPWAASPPSCWPAAVRAMRRVMVMSRARGVTGRCAPHHHHGPFAPSPPGASTHAHTPHTSHPDTHTHIHTHAQARPSPSRCGSRPAPRSSRRAA